jgi:predicted kinase
MKILIFGLSGSGKTTLSKKIVEKLEKLEKEVKWFNADNIRSLFDDWDFSYEGRLRQAYRMASHADDAVKNGRIAICDFICPTDEFRSAFHNKKKSDLIIWMDTVSESKYKDTDLLFEKPYDYDYRICNYNAELWSDIIVNNIINNNKPPKFDTKKPTVQLLGRFQPWHDGHTALFEKALEKTGQVAIEIRDCQHWNDSNPFNYEEVEKLIHIALAEKYTGKYIVFKVPNIVNITYGRDVGYTITQEKLDEEIENISATKIRKDMGLC